jgi:hypothetical protein
LIPTGGSDGQAQEGEEEQSEEEGSGEEEEEVVQSVSTFAFDC